MSKQESSIQSKQDEEELEILLGSFSSQGQLRESDTNHIYITTKRMIGIRCKSGIELPLTMNDLDEAKNKDFEIQRILISCIAMKKVGLKRSCFLIFTSGGAPKIWMKHSSVAEFQRERS